MPIEPQDAPSPLSPTPRPSEPAATRADVEGTMPVPAGSVDAKPNRQFSRAAATLLVLGMLGLGTFCVAPFLAPPAIHATGELAELVANKQEKTLLTQYSVVVTGAGACVTGLALLSLLAAISAGRFALASQWLAYQATLGSAILLAGALMMLAAETRSLNDLWKSVAQRQATGVQGDAHLTRGQQFHAAAGGPTLACGSFLLAAVIMHRRRVNRLLTLLFLGAIVALIPLGPALIYRNELGL
jgi:hypothetical protein